MVLIIVLFAWFWFSLPPTLFTAGTSYVIEDKDGKLLNASIADDGQWRFPYNERVPYKFAQCIINFEDKRFLFHNGADMLAMARAIQQNISRGKVVSGGSTLTMQVIRLSRKQPRNIWQKAIESILALRMELTYSKKEILALYCSNAPFGGNVVGLDAAAWRYYGRSPQQLSWGEMAALAVLPNSPSLVNVAKNRELLLKKRNRLLDNLYAEKQIDGITCELAKLEPLPGEPKPLPQLAPHLLQRFKEEFVKNKNNGLTRIKTTIDANLQRSVSQVIEQHHHFLKGNGINNAATLVLDVETGNALAYAGNIYHPENAELESHVDIIRSPRSPGSALKPFLYTSMLSDGLILPHSLIPDIPMQIGGYMPQNFDQHYDGAVPASKALARSLNIPAIKMLQQYKYARFYEVLKQSGITTLNRPAGTYGLSLVLGGCEVTMWDLAGAYANMARAMNHQFKNKGKVVAEDFHEPAYVNRQSPVVNKKRQAPNFDLTSIWFTFQAMQEVMRPGEEGLWQQFTSSQKIAWKTGTSFGFRDGWAIGVTPEHVVAVWVGNADGEGRPGLIGIETAAPVLFDIFRLLPSSKWFAEPAFDYSFLPVCRESGYRAGADCDHPDTLMVPRNGARAQQCAYHKKIHLDPSGAYRVTENCFAPSRMLHSNWFVLPTAMEWYYKQNHHDYKPLPAYKDGCGENSNGKQIELIYPQMDAKIYVPYELSGEKGKTVFTAAHRNSNAKIFWHLDENYFTTTSHFHQVALSPSPGKHILTLVDESGESITRVFEILGKETAGH